MNLIQKISAIAGAVFFSFWLFAAYDEGFELFDPDWWEEGFEEVHLQVSFALFVGSVVSYFVFKDKQNSGKDDKMHEIYENAVISEMEEEMIRKVDREIEEEAIKKVD